MNPVVVPVLQTVVPTIQVLLAELISDIYTGLVVACLLLIGGLRPVAIAALSDSLKLPVICARNIVMVIFFAFRAEHEGAVNTPISRLGHKFESFFRKLKSLWGNELGLSLSLDRLKMELALGALLELLLHLLFKLV